ncbi:MAG: DUF1460 domain-containing protein [Candidatus Marinimicrobia bacterium]|nr:DUF1460 domain-containing protein [Candidatus Neomarinimicrobiota bacterium]MDD5582813.1 DUF1460 domain-containing protein [Candidatus Neomarinimicrobiota bacterium]
MYKGFKIFRNRFLFIIGMLCVIGTMPLQSAKIPENTAFISRLSYVQIDSMLQANARRDLTMTDRMALYSEQFLGMPYSWTATGDGEWALYENQPLFNFDSTNCMVYCEHVLALSISDSWDNFFNNLQHIRYKEGIIGMSTRNHYTMADWLPENIWLLNNVSQSVGGSYTKTMTRTISHKTFFKEKGITDLRYVKPDRTLTIDYIPLNDLYKVKDHFQNGDIIALIFAQRDDIFSAHMAMMIKKKDGFYIREASNSKWTTFETAWDPWLKSVQNRKKYAGIAVMRIHSELNTPNRVILPWEIKTLRNTP